MISNEKVHKSTVTWREGLNRIRTQGPCDPDSALWGRPSTKAIAKRKSVRNRLDGTRTGSWSFCEFVIVMYAWKIVVFSALFGFCCCCFCFVFLSLFLALFAFCTIAEIYKENSCLPRTKWVSLTFKTDLSVWVEVSLFHHFVDFLVSHVFTQIRQHLKTTPCSKSGKFIIMHLNTEVGGVSHLVMRRHLILGIRDREGVPWYPNTTLS